MDSLPTIEEESPDVAANRVPLKMHLRIVDVGDYVYRVLSLRPQMGVRFSTNFFHETWHILTGEDGARTLGRIFWGLSFQKAEGTIAVIDAPHLVTTPFDGDPADRIVIAPNTTSTDTKRLQRLREALHRHPRSDKTVRLHTFGLPAMIERTYAERLRYSREIERLYETERMDRRAGMICYTAAPEILQVEGSSIYGMRGDKWGAYHYLAQRSGSHHADGEVQVFTNFADRVSAATVARREVIGEQKAMIADEATRRSVQDAAYYEQAARVATRVRRAKSLR